MFLSEAELEKKIVWFFFLNHLPCSWTVRKRFPALTNGTQAASSGSLLCLCLRLLAFRGHTLAWLPFGKTVCATFQPCSCHPKLEQSQHARMRDRTSFCVTGSPSNTECTKKKLRLFEMVSNESFGFYLQFSTSQLYQIISGASFCFLFLK